MGRSFGLSLVPLLLAGASAWATDVELDGLKSKAPESWKSAPASNKFRVYQFTLPPAPGEPSKEDAELVIFFFGPGGGGGVAENLKRWQSMFEGDAEPKVEKQKLDKAELTYLDVKGTFLSKFPPFDPNAKVTRKPNYRRLGVVFASQNGPYFITLTGPAKTMAKNKEAFDGWIKAFK